VIGRSVYRAPGVAGTIVRAGTPVPGPRVPVGRISIGHRPVTTNH